MSRNGGICRTCCQGRGRLVGVKHLSATAEWRNLQDLLSRLWETCRSEAPLGYSRMEESTGPVVKAVGDMSETCCQGCGRHVGVKHLSATAEWRNLQDLLSRQWETCLSAAAEWRNLQDLFSGLWETCRSEAPLGYSRVEGSAGPVVKAVEVTAEVWPPRWSAREKVNIDATAGQTQYGN
ncbi:hypothetical protein J6590_012011 [Homalodisca vitripennis]|nr:hypothetical protein J6590_012011 [Homalodisca vitripennis]